METDQKTPGQVLLPGLPEPHPRYVEDGILYPSRYDADHMRAYAIAAIAHDRANQPAASGAPEGWRLVPIEPTHEMIDATDSEIETYRDAFGHPFFMSYGEAKQAWDLMIAAAPEAPKP